MDVMTIVGYALGLGLLYFGASEGGGIGVFLNAHGLSIVVGGTIAMTLVNSSARTLWETLRACVRLFFPAREEQISKTVALMRQLSEQAGTRGIIGLQGIDKKFANGFLSRAVEVATVGGNAEFTRNVLEEDILQMRLRHQTTGNVLRTAGVLSPMVGLLGTLIGIVRVLQQISDPAKVGPSMAVALSTAFYGIFISSFIAMPIAGKLRERSNKETLIKQIVLEGVLGILKNERPHLLEVRLRSYALSKGTLAAGAFPVRQAAA